MFARAVDYPPLQPKIVGSVVPSLPPRPSPYLSDDVARLYRPEASFWPFAAPMSSRLANASSMSKGKGSLGFALTRLNALAFTLSLFPSVVHRLFRMVRLELRSSRLGAYRLASVGSLRSPTRALLERAHRSCLQLVLASLVVLGECIYPPLEKFFYELRGVA